MTMQTLPTAPTPRLPLPIVPVDRPPVIAASDDDRAPPDGALQELLEAIRKNFFIADLAGASPTPCGAASTTSRICTLP